MSLIQPERFNNFNVLKPDNLTATGGRPIRKKLWNISSPFLPERLVSVTVLVFLMVLQSYGEKQSKRELKCFHYG